MTEINGHEKGPFKIKSLSPKVFQIDLDTTDFTMYDSGGFAN